MKNQILKAPVLLVALALVACGGQKTPTNAPAAGSPPAAASAGAGGDAAGGNDGALQLKCPPKVTTGAPEGTAYDVIGVTPQMSYDDAAATILCANENMTAKEELINAWSIDTAGLKPRHGFVIEAPETPEETEARLARYRKGNFSDDENFRGHVAPGKMRFSATTVGAPGSERVISITSEQGFAAGAEPPFASIREALIAKYGQPISERHDSTSYRGERWLVWGRDFAGRPLDANSPTAGACTAASGLTLQPQCGAAVAATILPIEGNNELVSAMRVVSVMPAWSFEYFETATAELAAASAAARAQQVEQAKENAQAPKL